MNKQEIVNKWIEGHGAAGFDLKERNIILYDGGLFSIETEKKRMKKFLRFQKIRSGKYKGWFKIVNYKKKTTVVLNNSAVLWFEELDDTIKYLQSMKKMLNSIGYRTTLKKKK